MDNFDFEHMSPTKWVWRDIWLGIARGEIGVREIEGSEHNPRVLEYHAMTTLQATTDEIPWCSAYICWVFEKARIPSTKSAMARSWLGWGKGIEDPYEGCVVVFSRGDNPKSGHVGIYIKESSKAILVLGGNQRDQVGETFYSKSRLLGYREPSFYDHLL